MVGSDYEAYVIMFEAIGLGADTHAEWGYEWIAYQIYHIGGNAQAMFMTFSILIGAMATVFIKNFSPYPLFSLLLYILVPIFFLTTLNGIRQFFAVYLFACSLVFVKNRKLLPFLACIAIGATIHKTILVTLPMYFLLHKKYKNYQYILGTLIFIFGMMNLELILGSFGLVSVYFFYSNDFTFNFLTAINIALSIFFMAQRDKLVKEREDSMIFVNMLYVSSIISLSTFFVDLFQQFVLRMTAYFTIALLILIPVYAAKYQQLLRRASFIGLFLIFGGLYFYRNVSKRGVSARITPYSINTTLYSK
jgi:hypothetical protein